MKYNVPYGLPDETTLYGTPYVNGNPSTGTAGSIPPAASIEYDQREIVAVIQYAFDKVLFDWTGTPCAAPSNADLTQLLKAIYGISNRARVVVPFSYYVDGGAGNDANDGLTAATAFKTIQHAVDVASGYAPGPNAITIRIAPFTYTGFTTPNYSIPQILIQGDTTTPTSCVIDGGTTWAAGCGSYNTLTLSYCKLQATGGQHVGPGSSGVVAFPYGTVLIGQGVTFGRCDLACMNSAGAVNIETGFHINGSVGDYILYSAGGSIICGALGSSLEIFIDAPITVQAFALANTGGYLTSTGVTWTGAANVTGQRYSANYNSMIDTNVSGVNYFPGTVAGSVANGGTYR
jgi:hypothetical protein